MSAKIKVGILFGGRSVEHEVSVLTGFQALGAIDSSKYDVTPVYIARDNVWYMGEKMKDIAFFRQEQPALNELTVVLPAPSAKRGKLILIPEDEGGLFSKPKRLELDCILPACHGTFGEDGCLQGLLEMAGVPYASSDVRGSSTGMDKLLTKAVLTTAGIPVLPYCAVEKSGWESAQSAILDNIEDDIGYPAFVKPAILGSSVGVSRANDRSELETAVDLAFHFGFNILVEPALTDFTEINCAVLDGDPPIPSILEQPIAHGALLSFDDKYKGNAKKGASKGGKGMAAQTKLIPAPLDEELTEYIQALAVGSFKAIGAGGVARVDFLIDKEGKVFVNELNNIPGSFAFYLWEHMGKSFTQLLDKMIERAYEVNQRRNRTTFSFTANLLAGR